MRVLIVAATVLAFSPPVAWGDPWDDILSIARRVGYEAGYVAPSRPRYIVRDHTYDPASGGYFYYGNARLDRVPRSLYFRSPASEELLQMDFPLLQDVARAAAVDFDRWLITIPAGEVWRKHFEMPALLDLLFGDQSAPPSAAERQQMLRILDIYDRAVATSDLSDLTSRPSARTLQAALRELVTPPDQRLMRQLSLNARALNRALDAFSTGVTWQRFLALSDEIIAAADKPPGDVGPQRVFNTEELNRIAARYDRVSRNPEYASIAALPEFQSTHARLAELANPPSRQPPPLPAAVVAEELPPPEPQTR